MLPRAQQTGPKLLTLSQPYLRQVAAPEDTGMRVSRQVGKIGCARGKCAMRNARVVNGQGGGEGGERVRQAEREHTDTDFELRVHDGVLKVDKGTKG